jgi:hypothetical protein
VGLALSAADKAVLKAETATEKRFESVNEFRQTLSDQTRSFLRISEHTVEMTAVNERLSRTDDALRQLQVWQGNIAGRMAVIAAAMTIVIALVSVLANYLTSRV